MFLFSLLQVLVCSVFGKNSLVFSVWRPNDVTEGGLLISDRTGYYSSGRRAAGGAEPRAKQKINRVWPWEWAGPIVWKISRVLEYTLKPQDKLSTYEELAVVTTRNVSRYQIIGRTNQSADNVNWMRNSSRTPCVLSIHQLATKKVIFEFQYTQSICEISC